MTTITNNTTSADLETIKQCVDHLINMRGYAYTTGYLESMMFTAVNQMDMDKRTEFLNDFMEFVKKVEAA